uniref:NADH-ubiquinone oxidoreductase chain 2 n=1 Tax=Pristomyrmex punctatus TaxID=507543 RepID=E5RPZ4_9HYME|nr:NADH dehydrogenase subunit 2 [Pristomyrmex punctatus]
MYIIFMPIFLKNFIMSNLIMFTLFCMFFSDLFMIWFFLEISNFLFITLMMMSMKNKHPIFFYFIIQMSSSLMMIMLFTTSNMSYFNHFFNEFLIIIIMMLKLNIPPFHFWLPMIANYLPWIILLTMMTLQKIIPFLMLSLFNLKSIIIYYILLSCSLLPPMMIMKSKSIKTTMSYSSINQMSWLSLINMFEPYLWLKYFILYSFILLMLFKYFKETNISMNFKKFNYKFNDNKMTILTYFFMLTLAGMPPFSFFIMKWFVVYSLTFNMFFFSIMIIMIISSLFMMYLYLNLMIFSLYFYKTKTKLYSYPSPYFMNTIFFLLFLTLIMLML